jgi:peroxiredoxin
MVVSFGFSATYIALWTLAILQGLLVLAVLQRLEKLRQSFESGNFVKSHLPPGSLAPQFSGGDQYGRQVGLENLNDPRVILFLSPDCFVCKALVESIGSLAVDLPPTVGVCQGEREGCEAFSRRLGPTVGLLIDVAKETTALYGVITFPTAVVIDSQRKIRGYSHPKTVEDLKRAFDDSLAEDKALPNLSLAPSDSK